MTRRLRAIPLALVTLVAGLPAAGQEVAKANESGGWIAIAIGLVLSIGVIVGSFMSSRRTHQD